MRPAHVHFKVTAPGYQTLITHVFDESDQYLDTDADRLLRGRYTGAVGSALFSTVAEATLLAAWMSYDSAPRSALAQRYFIQALALAQAGGDQLLGASILDAMSHQATYTGRFTEAANLARAARAGTTGIATATLTAHFHTMEARALANGYPPGWITLYGSLADDESLIAPARGACRSMTELDLD